MPSKRSAGGTKRITGQRPGSPELKLTGNAVSGNNNAGVYALACAPTIAPKLILLISLGKINGS